MAYTNSPLVSYTKLSPNHSGQRTHSIDRITPHCVVGQCSVETLGNIFLPTSRQASSNYGIGVDGRVGMYVEEKNRSWCSSSAANDQRAITIECASDNTEPYAFKDMVYKRLIELCTDICRRNGKTKLLWLGDKAKTLNYTPKSDEMVLTVHRWFANKSCPGNWMYARMGDLASRVTAALGGDVKPADPVKPTGSIKAGDLVTITGSTYYGGKSIPGWVKKLRWYVVEVSGDRAVINRDESGRYAIMSPVKTSALALAGTKPADDYRIHTVAHGDTLWAIAKKYLGNGSRYTEIVMMQRLITKAAYEEERKSVKMQITDISEKISERRAKRVPESEYVPITEFSEEKTKRFLSKVVVTMFTVTFVFYNGAKITRTYDNGQPGNKVGWNKKKEES